MNEIEKRSRSAATLSLINLLESGSLLPGSCEKEGGLGMSGRLISIDLDSKDGKQIWNTI